MTGGDTDVVGMKGTTRAQQIQRHGLADKDLSLYASVMLHEYGSMKLEHGWTQCHESYV